jgi:ketosteroid isomerase-like protein
MMHVLTTLTSAMALSMAMASGAIAAETTAAPAPAAAAAAPAGPSDKALIQALEKGFTAAFNAKDSKKIMSYYAREGLFVFDVTPPRQYVGWAAYKKDWDDIFAMFPGPTTFKLSDLSITVAGDVAYGHSIQDSNFTAKDGSKTELVVRVTDVYRKIGGKWLIVQEHVSIPVDLNTMKPDPMSKP